MNDILTVRNVSKSFGGLKAISELSFGAAAGSITAIIGPNGAGKTTLFNLISGLYGVDSGEIRFKQTRVDTLRSFMIPYLGISRTFQKLSIFQNMNVLENVMVGRYTRSSSGFFSCALNLRRYRREEKDIREKSLFWLEFMNLGDIRERKIREIPFEKQRLIEITRAIAGEPELILLDEPAAGLNLTETRNLIDVIYKIKELGKTLLIVEHDMELVMEISDTIIVLNFGQKIAEGTPREIQGDERVISVYLGK